MSGPIWVVGSSDTTALWAEALRGLGPDVLELPWSDVTAVADGEALEAALELKKGELVLLTSRNALRFVPYTKAKDKPAACVGAQTAEAARRAGLSLALV